MRRLIHVPVLCLLALTPAALFAAPPALEIPAEVRPAGEYVRVTPKTDGVSVVYVGLSGLDAFPSEELKDGKRFLLPTRGVPAGRYKFAAVASSKEGEQTRADFVVVIGDAPGPGPQPEPGPQPKPDPAPVKADSVFVVVVEDATATRTIETGKALNDPWWATLKPRHDYRHYRSDSPTAQTNGYVTTAQGVGFPAVLVMDQKDGTVLKKFKLTTTAEIDGVVKAVSK